MPEVDVGGLHERTRRAVRAEIAAVAMRLFLEYGFAATTMDRIANEVGLSRRSLFRYFGTKEDIVLGDHEDQGRLLLAALESRPMSESPWEALRSAFGVFVEQLAYAPGDLLALTRMLHDTPSLHARQAEKQRQWLEPLTPNIAARLAERPDELTELRARAIVAAALSCSELAMHAWARSNGEADMAELFDAAVAAVRA
ncbi:TetR/AcrR family transcriptional regulator [Nocardia sp. CA-107356]|uniref:TetR/AcrR family transcriptional regulator n=1 Tax=Nocardia sp. CA-107356 TaxID=3239972 RepID=UPI003D8F19D6